MEEQPPEDSQELVIDGAVGEEGFGDDLTAAGKKTISGPNPMFAGEEEFIDQPTMREPSPLFKVDRDERSRFIIESLRSPVASLIETGKFSPENVPGMIKDILAGKLKNDPQLGDTPASEKDVKITIALIAENVRRYAEARNDQITAKSAEDLILASVGVKYTELGDFLRGASIIKGGTDKEDTILEAELKKAGL